MNRRNDDVVITLVKLREGVEPERFADFASSMDLPTWRAKEVVLGFDTYRVADRDAAGVDADFVEVMQLRSLAEWEQVAASDPDVAPLGTAFDELVDKSRSRRILLTRVDAA